MKKQLNILLILLLFVSLMTITACGKNNINYNPDNFIEDTSNPQIVKEKISIKLFVPKAAIHGSWKDMFIFKWMEERTNIHIDFVEVPLASYSEKRGLQWENKKDMVDGFFTCNNKDEVTQYSTLGALAAFNDDNASDSYSGNYGNLIEKYMPNYKKWMDTYPEIRLYTEQADGKIYSLCAIDTEYGAMSTQYINYKWLQKTDWFKNNNRLPETIEELEVVLTEFSEKDMNGNGNKYDEVPLSYFPADETTNFLMSSFGFVGTGVELDTRETIYDEESNSFVSNPTYDQIVWVPATKEYREYLKLVNKWYNSGLIDQNIYENNSASLSALGYQNRLGCFASGGAYLIVGGEYAEDYVPIGPLTSKYNNKKIWYEYNYQFDPTILIIPSTSPYKRELARWIDVFYDESNVAIQSYGVEGVNWVWDNSTNGTKEDGTLDSWHFVVPSGLERETYRATITYSAGLGGCILQNEWNKRESTPIQAQVFRDRSTYVPYLKPSIPSMIYTSEQMSLISTVETAMGTVTSGLAYFIRGGASGYDINNDTDWNNFIEKMKKAGNYEITGYEALVQQYQNAYNLYKEKLSKITK